MVTGTEHLRSGQMVIGEFSKIRQMAKKVQLDTVARNNAGGIQFSTTNL